MIDGHCHLDSKIGNCSEAVEFLLKEAPSAGIEGLVLINLPEQGFTNKQVLRICRGKGRYFRTVFGINPLCKNAKEELETLRGSQAVGIKLHPRLHGYNLMCDAAVAIAEKAADAGLAVFVDSFCDGRNLALGNDPGVFLRFAETTGARMALCHSGGHRIMDMLMVAKSCTNIWLDLSYTLLYFRNSSTVVDQVKFAIGSMRGKRIFWGSDYPDRPYETTVTMTLKLLGNMSLSSAVFNAVSRSNVLEMLGEDH
mgnify:CR=1 FL=1